jgi:hypothetical protein
VSFSLLATRFVSAFAGDAAADAKRAMTPATAARRLTPLREGGREGGRRQGRTDARGFRRRRDRSDGSGKVSRGRDDRARAEGRDALGRGRRADGDVALGDDRGRLGDDLGTEESGHRA